MSWFSFKDMRLRRKIMVITVISTFTALVMACLTFFLYERMTYPETRLKTLSTWAQIIATASGITGFTFPGMMLLPGCSAGREISASPETGRRESCSRRNQYDVLMPPIN